MHEPGITRGSSVVQKLHVEEFLDAQVDLVLARFARGDQPQVKSGPGIPLAPELAVQQMAAGPLLDPRNEVHG